MILSLSFLSWFMKLFPFGEELISIVNHVLKKAVVIINLKSILISDSFLFVLKNTYLINRLRDQDGHTHQWPDKFYS